MEEDKIYEMIAEATGIEVEYLKLGHEVQMVRPSEVVEIINKALSLNVVPTKKYEIDFDGNVLAGIEISNNTPKIVGAMNGHGNGISINQIKITEK
jgi:hypothetical protein